MACPACGDPRVQGAAPCPACGNDPSIDDGRAVLVPFLLESEALPVYAAADQGSEATAQAAVPRRSRRWTAGAVVAVVLAVGAGSAVARDDGGPARAHYVGFGLELELPAPLAGAPEVAWRRKLAVVNAVSQGSDVAAVDRVTGEVVVIGATDGDERWRAESLGPSDRTNLAWLGDGNLLASGPAGGDGQLELRVLDRDDGDVRWSYTVNPNAYASPMGDDLVVVYQYGENERRQRFTVLSADDGRTQWSTRPDAVVGFGDGALVVLRGERLSSLDLADGHQRWTRSVPDLRGRSERVAQADGSVVIATDASRLLGLAADDGDQRWSRALTTPIQRLLTTDGGVVVAIDREQATAYDTATGRVRWQVDADGWGETFQLVRFDGQDELLAFGPEGLATLDPRDGDRVGAATSARTGPETAMADGLVYSAGRTGGVLLGLDAATLDPRWEVSAGESIRAVAATDRGVVVATVAELIAYR